MLLKPRLKTLTKDWSVGKKLVIGEAVLVLALLSVFTFYVASYCGGLLEENHIADMNRQVTLVKGIFEVYDHTVMESTDKFAAVLTSHFPGGFQVDPRRTVKVGGVETPTLLNGGKVLNNNFDTIDRFSRLTGTVGTIFVRSGDDFIRVTTSLKKEDGTRAVGTNLGKNHPGYAALIKGDTYLGHATLFGRDYSTKYTPIKGAAGETVAILFVGVDTTSAMNFMKQQIKAIKIGSTGYIFAIDAEDGEHQGMMLVHPYQEGKNLLSVKSADGREYVREMIKNHNGTISYYWLNKEAGETSPRLKTVVYTYYDKKKVIIAAGAYEDEVIAQAVQLRYILFGVTALFILIIVGVLHFVTLRVVVNPLRQAVHFAGVVAGGDLSTSVEIEGKDEIGQLGEALNQMVVALKQMVHRIRYTSGQVASAANAISSNSSQLAEAAHSQSAATEETSSTMTQMAVFIETVAGHAESLAGNAEGVLSSIQELGASGEEVAKNAESMACSVAEVSTTIEQMTRSIGRMSGNNQELQKVVSESSATIEELAFSIKEAAKTVEDADAVAKSAALEAGAGEQAIHQALEGMVRVGDSIDKVATSLAELDKRSGKIDDIVRVIGGIAEQSNLLALNASIQAAQAGEAGLGFSVVAEEMRTLAYQSAEAAKEIGKVIADVQADTEKTVQLGELAAREAQLSVELSGAAGKSLGAIIESIEKTTRFMSNIARMTAEQAKASNQVVRAVERMSQASDVVADTAQEQAAGSGQIRSSADIMNNLTQLVTIATREQSIAAKQITSAVYAMSAMSKQVAEATAEQKVGVKHVVSAVENISDLTQGNLTSVEQLSIATRGLSDQADGLSGLIAEFKVN